MRSILHANNIYYFNLLYPRNQVLSFHNNYYIGNIPQEGQE